MTPLKNSEHVGGAPHASGVWGERGGTRRKNDWLSRILSAKHEKQERKEMGWDGVDDP